MPTGNISTVNGVVENITSASGQSENDLDTTINGSLKGGNISIGGEITQTINSDGASSGPLLTGENLVVAGYGNVTMNGSISQSGTGLNLESIQNYAALTSTGTLEGRPK